MDRVVPAASAKRVPAAISLAAPSEPAADVRRPGQTSEGRPTLAGRQKPTQKRAFSQVTRSTTTPCAVKTGCAPDFQRGCAPPVTPPSLLTPRSLRASGTRAIPDRLFELHRASGRLGPL